MFELNYETEVKIENIPLPWIPRIELYYPDLPQFPIIYIHTHIDEQRVIACPVAVSYDINEGSSTARFNILTNTEPSEIVKSKIASELSERIGYSHKISKADVIACCNGNLQYISLLENLWEYIESSYGESIPYGKYYEEVFSMVRFVAAWQPKTGRQSEMRMLYNFMSAFGEPAQMLHKWSHLEFYVIPNLNDIYNRDFAEFTKFSILKSAMLKLFENHFTIPVEIAEVQFLSMQRAWKQNKDDFISGVTRPMFEEGLLSDDEKLYAEMLVDAFNRHAWRAAYFISAYINIATNYNTWTKDFFVNFYKNGSKLKGYSEKVIACFLQQGFLNSEAIPIDTWIKTFYEYPLGISDSDTFFNSFSNLGKLERVIWLSSQSNKTNMKNFFDILWCQRYGTIGNGELRGINPIACYSCQLKYSCVGATNSRDSLVRLIDVNQADDLNALLQSNNTINFICVLENGIPKKCFKNNRGLALLIDEFSGYILTMQDRISQELILKETVSFESFILSR